MREQTGGREVREGGREVSEGGREVREGGRGGGGGSVRAREGACPRARGFTHCGASLVHILAVSQAYGRIEVVDTASTRHHPSQ